MSKRFTETMKWDDPWFCNLKPMHKLFWIFICDRCDNAGIWNPNWAICEAFIGAKLGGSKDLLCPFHGRIKPLPSGKLWVVKFVEFQQKTTSLNPCNPAHKNIIQLLAKEGITDYEAEILNKLDDAPSMGHDMDHVMVPSTGIGTGEGKVKERTRANEVELVEYCKSIGLPDSDGYWLFEKWEANGWKNGTSPIKDWKGTIRAWKLAGYMASQKNGFNSKPSPSQPEFDPISERTR